jgi:hypothetical protein
MGGSQHLLALPMTNPCSTCFTVGKRVCKQPDEVSDEVLASNVKTWVKERKLQMLTLIANMRELKKSTAEVHFICIALYPDEYKYTTCNESAMNFMRRTHRNYLANDKVAVERKEGYGGQNAYTFSEELRQTIKTEALKQGGSVRSVCRALAGVGIVIGKDRILREMTGNYRDALEALVKYKKARTVCFLTEQMKIDRYNFAVMWTSPQFYGPTGGFCAKPDKRSAKFFNMIKDWLFSDEKSFHTFGSNTKRPPKWVEIGDTYHVPCYKNTILQYHTIPYF